MSLTFIGHKPVNRAHDTPLHEIERRREHSPSGPIKDT
jgi:hypothetical protein